MKLGQDQINAIVDAVVLKMSPPKTEPVEDPSEDGAYYDDEQEKVVYTDPAVKAADEATEQCLKSLPQGTVAYRGRNGTQIINHSLESLEAIDNWKKSRRQYRTRTNVR